MPEDLPTSEVLPVARQPSGVYRICLVCLGNICRSPMAEVALRAELERAGLDDAVTVDSAGTGDWHLGEPMDDGALAELARRGYDGASHRARQFRPDWFGRYDLVLAMDSSNFAALRRMAPSAARDRVRMFRSFDPVAAADRDADPHRGEVPDPYGGPDRGYTLAFDLIAPAARGLVAQLAALRPRSGPAPGRPAHS